MCVFCGELHENPEHVCTHVASAVQAGAGIFPPSRSAQRKQNREEAEGWRERERERERAPCISYVSYLSGMWRSYRSVTLSKTVRKRRWKVRSEVSAAATLPVGRRIHSFISSTSSGVGCGNLR